jgi:2-C-methyl-D-erythritol 4-phosphate cytidylyltransferase
MEITVLVPAAGSGSRMGAGVNKQYLQLAGRPILAHTLALFEEHPAVRHVIVVSPPEEIPYCRQEVVQRYGLSKVLAVVAGGAERQDSVRRGLQACPGKDEEIVLIHDGVRPLLAPGLIDQVAAAAARVGAAVVGVPVKDTIKEVVEGCIAATPDRRRLWQAQTPQGFALGIIREAHAAAWQAGFRGTDDASLVERLGRPVAIIEGSYRNIKITTPEDLVLAETYLAGDGR